MREKFNFHRGDSLTNWSGRWKRGVIEAVDENDMSFVKPGCEFIDFVGGIEVRLKLEMDGFVVHLD